jgi:hypothetical protein
MMRGVSAVVCLGALLCAPAFAAPQTPAATVHSREVAQVQATFADLVRAQGRELVVYDADGLVRPFGDAVMGRTWDTVPRNARGSFERIAEATGERRAFSMIVRTGGKVECRVGPTSPDQAWMNLLAAYSGQERTALARERLRLSSALFQRFVLRHEVGHCTDPHAFDRDRDPMRNLLIRHRAEAYGDTFSILSLAAEGTDQAALSDIVKIRSLYMSASSLGADAERRSQGIVPSSAEVAGYEHVAYWNIDAMKAAIAMAPRVRGADGRTIAAIARAIVDADGVTAETLVRVHRALAKESGYTHAEAEIAAAEAERALIRSAGAGQLERAFDRDRWEREFLLRLKAAGAVGEGPAAAIASERDRLRGIAATSGSVADAGAIEEALGRLAELSMKGYASVTDPPVVVSSTGNSTNRIPVAAMPSRLDTVGPVPSLALKGALESATAKTTMAAKVVLPPRTATAAPIRPVPEVPISRVKPVKRPIAVATVQTQPKASMIDDLTGISPAMARVRTEAAARKPLR